MYDLFMKIGIFLLVVGVIFVAYMFIMEIRAEVNEPDSGEVYDLVYYEPWVQQVPQYTMVPDGNGGFRQQFTHFLQVPHPEKFEVKYRVAKVGEEGWDCGDDIIPGHVWRELKVGDMYYKPGTRENEEW